MLRRRFGLRTTAGFVIAAMASVVTIGSATAATITTDAGGNAHLASCPAPYRLVDKFQMKDGNGDVSPGVIWFYMGPGNMTACAVTNRLNQANGSAGNTSIALVNAAGGVARDAGPTRFSRGPVIIKTPGCVYVKGTMQYGTMAYSFEKSGWCGNKTDNSAIDAVWKRLAQCESGMTNDGGAPYYGYFQFSESTWLSVGGSGYPNDFSYDQQLVLAKKLQARSGWGQWPVCSKVALNN